MEDNSQTFEMFEKHDKSLLEHTDQIKKLETLLNQVSQLQSQRSPKVPLSPKDRKSLLAKQEEFETFG